VRERDEERESVREGERLEEREEEREKGRERIGSELDEICAVSMNTGCGT